MFLTLFNVSCIHKLFQEGENKLNVRWSKSIKWKRSFGALEVALNQYKQAELVSEVINPNSDATINKVVVTGMGGSALAALLIKSWQESKLNITFEIVRDYKLPNYVDDKTFSYRI